MGSDYTTTFQKVIDEFRKEIELLRKREDDVGVQYYHEARERMSYLLAQEDAYWRRSVQVNWLKHGDTTSKFFYAMASARSKRNYIVKLHSNDGEIVESQAELCGVAKEYFDANRKDATYS